MNPFNNMCTLLCGILMVTSCAQPESNQQTVRSDGQQPLIYAPSYGQLSIKITPYSEIQLVRLLNDTQKEQVNHTLNQRTLALTADSLPINEVYYLEIIGMSMRDGTKGMLWTEYVPIFLANDDSTVEINLEPFTHKGSISGLRFYVSSNDPDQLLLNAWQQSLNERSADRDGQLVHYTLGAQGSQKVGIPKSAIVDSTEITRRFIEQKRPLTTTLFLAGTTNAHRRLSGTLREVYTTLTPAQQQTKYAIDVAQRLQRINVNTPVLNPVTQLTAVDANLKPLDWNSFSDYKYLLLAFWNSTDAETHKPVQQLAEQAGILAAAETAVIHLAVENRLNKWAELSKPLNLANSYKLRNEVLQPLIDTLYLTDLPRFVLMRPDGSVVHSDVFPEDLSTILD